MAALYHSDIMVNGSRKDQIEWLLDQAERSLGQHNWQAASEFSGTALRLDPHNEVAHGLREAAEGKYETTKSPVEKRAQHDGIVCDDVHPLDDHAKWAKQLSEHSENPCLTEHPGWSHSSWMAMHGPGSRAAGRCQLGHHGNPWEQQSVIDCRQTKVCGRCGYIETVDAHEWRVVRDGGDPHGDSFVERFATVAATTARGITTIGSIGKLPSLVA